MPELWKAGLMKRKVHLIGLVGCLLLFCLTAYIGLQNLHWLVVPYSSYLRTLEDVRECLSIYLHENGGYFPESKEDLIAKHCLRIGLPSETEPQWINHPTYMTVARGNGYWPRDSIDSSDYTGDQTHWTFCMLFDRYRIMYGVQIEDLELRGDKLYCRASGKHVRLLEPVSPVFERLGPHMDAASVELYHEMLRLRQRDYSR
jgi:hypothetical protein